MNKKGFSLIEAIVASAVLGIMMVSTIDFMSSFMVAESTFNNEIANRQDKLNLLERLSSSIKPATYVYKPDTTIYIPTQNSTTSVTNNVNAIAVLVPKFNADGTLKMAGTNITQFSGVAFSIIPRKTWDGTNSNKYVLLQTILDNSSLDISTDPNDSLQIMVVPTTNWANGKSYVLADDLMPATTTNMGNDAFATETDRDKVKFSFIPKANGTYFPSDSGTEMIDDNQYMMSVSLRNWRATTY